MRKTRKGSRPSAADPTPPSQPDPVAKVSKPVFCLWCRCNPAIKLSGTRMPDNEPVFCSMECATIFAFDCIQQGNFTYCLKHHEWSDKRGKCLSCKLEREGYTITIQSVADDAQAAAEGGVS